MAQAQFVGRKTAPRLDGVTAVLLRRDLEHHVRGVLRDRLFVSLRFAQDIAPAARSASLCLLVTEPWDAAGAPVSPAIHWLKRAYPSTTVVVYRDPTPADHRESISLARAGVDTIVLRGIDDDPTMLRAAVKAAGRSRVQLEVMEAIDSGVPADIAAFVQYCLSHASDTVTIEQAARALGIDRKTLRNRLTKHQSMRPREVLAWCRLLVAARLLEDPGRSTEQIGFAIGCGSGTALRNLFVRHTGLRPLEVRGRGGLKYLLGVFAESLRRRSC